MKHKKKSTDSLARQRDGTKIAYQSKDISSKYFAENLRGLSLAVYGIKKAEIVEVRPTNLPLVEANELRLDNLFVMEDGAFAIVDYESTYLEENKSKYLGYIARVSKSLYNEYGEYKRIRIIIIYTADISRGSTKPVLDMGAFRMELEEAFLSDLESEHIKGEIIRKIGQGDTLTDEDMMRLIIYPLTHKGRDAQQRAVTEAIDIAEGIDDEQRMGAVLSGILVFSDKIISEDDARRIVRRFEMTKVERILEERYQEKYQERERKAKLSGGDNKLIALVCRKLAKGKKTEEIAEDLDEDIKDIERILNAAMPFDPDNYDVDAIRKKWRGEIDVEEDTDDMAKVAMA